MPSPVHSFRQALSAWLPRHRGWWLVAAAFVAGVLLFLLLWLGQRDEFDFYRADGAGEGSVGTVFAPLPVPLPAGDVAASGMEAEDAPAEAVRIDHQAPPPMAEVGTDAPDAAAPPPAPQAPGSGDAAMPTLVSAPSPEYPRAAIRARAQGDVVIRIDVGANGIPASLELVRSSRNRALDRAALEAVRNWRFRPAMRNGTPVASSVLQTVSFTLPE